MKKRKRWEYAMYKGEELLAMGTSNEICEQMNISIKTFWFYRTKTYQNRYKDKKGNRREIVRIDNDLQEY